VRVEIVPQPTVHDVLEKHLATVVYQPIVDLATLRVFAYETLVRCEGFASPVNLIEAAAKVNMTGRLGRRIRELALAGCPDHGLFVNIDPTEFDEGWLVRPDDPIFIHDHSVHLEITEGVPLSHYRHCHGVLHEVRRRGAKVAVDDLGAGFSNLKYIADLEPEIVKLDRGLVENLHKNPRMQVLVETMVTMCERLGAKVIAEGIETAEELKAAADAGVHYGQGYLIARPHPIPPKIDATALLKIVQA
jgi:EAL domain-containing protein (putative c-di-GMP-specific phosphodiesterase class I)